MEPPRDQAGGLAEASRLLQEGLQLLDERQREVDRMLEGARERALNIREEAEQRAREITAQAERERRELEAHVATLRGELTQLREQLEAQRATAATTPAPPPPVAEPAVAAEPALAAEPEPAEPVIDDATDDDHGTEVELEPAPQWGRRSNGSGGRQAVRERKGPGWLRWLRPQG